MPIWLPKRFAFVLLLICQTQSLLAQSDPPEQERLRQADSLSAIGSVKEAEKIYKEILSDDPVSVAAMHGLGSVALRKTDWGDVKDWSKKVLKIEPADLNAHYRLGVAYRETGKFKALLMRKADFNKSREHLTAVVHADSSFLDALYQLALLERLQDHWQKAIKLGHNQVRIRPDLIHTHAGLFKLYRRFLANDSDEHVQELLASRRGDWPRYFSGENHRKRGRFALADSILLAMLNSELEMSKQPLYLSLIRLNVQQNKDSTANAYITNAVDAIETPVDAAIHFEDLKYTLSGGELARYQNAKAVAEQVQVFRTFYAARNPIPAAPVNFRAIEHFRRLVVAEQDFWFDGVRSQINNPDQLTRLQFPMTYSLNEEFNDKGLIFIRHGAPNEIAKTGGAELSNESWHYYSRNDRPEYIFHFLIGQYATGNNWRLAPYLSSRRMLADRLGWDQDLDKIYFASSELERNSSIHSVSEKSQASVLAALATDTHTWSTELEPIRSAAYGAYFRGSSGATRVEIYVGIPMVDLTPDPPANDLILNYGAVILDQENLERGRHFDSLDPAKLQLPQLFNETFIHKYIFEVAPGPYNLSYYSGLNDPAKVGGGRFPIQVPRFDENTLSLSDIALAHQIDPERLTSQSDTDNPTLVPNPSKEFLLNEPVALYFEVYNLSKNSEEETSFEIESILTQKKGKKFLGIFGGGKKQSLSIKNRVSGEESLSREHTSFDVSKLPEGAYTLTVKVHDMQSGKSTEKSIELGLKKT